jgi:hypothetical protein
MPHTSLQAGTPRYHFIFIHEASDDARDYGQTYPRVEIRGYKQTLDDCTICQVEQDPTSRHRRAAEEHLTLQP